MTYTPASLRASCKRGHVWIPENHLYFKSSNGKTYPKCRVCKNERQQKAKAGEWVPPIQHDIAARRFIPLDCGHQLIFSPPLPGKYDVIWCIRCDIPVSPVGVGDRVPVRVRAVEDEG